MVINLLLSPFNVLFAYLWYAQNFALDLAIGSSTSIPSILVGMVVDWDMAHT
jgi:hypothetical protein